MVTGRQGTIENKFCLLLWGSIPHLALGGNTDGIGEIPLKIPLK